MATSVQNGNQGARCRSGAGGVVPRSMKRAAVRALRIVRSLFSLVLLLLALPVAAQDFPTKPIRWIVAFSAGGPTDTIARLVGAKLTEAWGQPVVIDNRGGAGGTIAAAMTARAAPDGHTILYVSASHAIAPSVYKSLPYDTVADFAPVTVIATTPFVLVVSPGVPANSVGELIALAKSKPGELKFASSGIGASNHLAGELFKTLAGVDIIHVPYKGQSQTTPDLISGAVSMTFGSPVQTLPLISAKRVRLLGVTSKTRYSALPDTPTIEESGLKGYEASTWHGALAPRGTPPRVVEKLQKEMARALHMPDVQASLVKIGVNAVGSSPGEFSSLLKTEVVRWADIAKRSGVVAQ